MKLDLVSGLRADGVYYLDMNRRAGFVLLGLVIFVTVLALTSMVTVLEQDTRLKRFREDELRLNLSALRRGIDLYRYKYSVTAPDPAKIAALDLALQSGPAEAVAGILAGESFIRARIATGTMEWRMVSNLLKNPSFEIDNGTDFGLIGSWRGNSMAEDGIPDGWQLNAAGAEQIVNLDETGIYVVSMWARCESDAARARLQIWSDNALPLVEFAADQTDWKRYFMSFTLAAPGAIRLVLGQSGPSGDSVFVDGVMLEKWSPPADVPVDARPVPSAWTRSINVVPAQAIAVLQQRQFNDLIPEGADPASFAWWFQW